MAPKTGSKKPVETWRPERDLDCRLIGRMEEGKGDAYASKIDVHCSDRNRIIAHKNVLIATGGSATAEMAMRIPLLAIGSLAPGLLS